MQTADKYIDLIYDYKGQWDSPSRCGLKVYQRSDGHFVIVVTELYTGNPGTSVTQWCAPLATTLIGEYGIEPEQLIFIERTPDTGSKLVFLRETFDRVSFTWDGIKYTSPEWQRLSREEVDKLLSE
ncbi:MAG: hypothetical protein FJY10_05165 [Bacteroidetes bacterium]|nr:hypothetical protein [Bacteroidota bacterium]